MLFQVATQLPTVGTKEVQGFVNIIWYMLIGMIVLGVSAYLLLKLYRRMSYTYSVDIYRKVGNTEIQSMDVARQVKLAGNYMMHFAGLNKYAPVVSPKYMRIRTYKLLGLFPRSKLHFAAYLFGESLFPIEVKENPGLTPINLDLFNYMQARLQANQQKYNKQNLLIQLMPVIAVGLVVVMFIVGMIFYTKHVEAVASMIISAAKDQANLIAERAGAQVLQ